MSILFEKEIAESWSHASNAYYIDELYARFLNGDSIDQTWVDYFSKNDRDFSLDYLKVAERFKDSFKRNEVLVSDINQGNGIDLLIQKMQKIYRIYGHLNANTNPLMQQKDFKSIDIEKITSEIKGYKNQNLPAQWIKQEIKNIQDFERFLKNKYCGSFGFEIEHLEDLNQRKWFYDQIETNYLLTNHQKKSILERLTASEGLEKYLGAKYPGVKRFSIEGADSLLILLDRIIEESANKSAKEIVIGMAHRGRLNVLVNLLGKNPSNLFSEFEGHFEIEAGTGDVKYHQGYSSELMIDHQQIHLSLAFNPSHLEIVSPVVMGSCLARQQLFNDLNTISVVPIIIHGDSAFSGQGVVLESMNMAKTRGYGIGGTIHLIVNNQVGFTTSEPADTRSTRYCTDIAKMMNIPVIHVNGDDPEAVYQAGVIAALWRANFHADIIIDLICYRRHGHNEADEPAVTQPLMYQFIRQHPTTRQIYAQKLIQEGVISVNEEQKFQNDYKNKLDQGICTNPLVSDALVNQRRIDWSSYLLKKINNKCDTTVDKETLKKIGSKICENTKGVQLHSRVEKIYKDRAEMYSGDKLLDWGAAEVLAYASIIEQGVPVRLSGQDCRRGTFFHRHVSVYDQKSGENINLLDDLVVNQSKFTVIDSLLSEEAVLAFEYGFAATSPNQLVIWEAQFGDFANGAQVVIDQFIASGEQKWGRYSSLILLLPHGYEGQGPEHSSARVERFLQLAAEDNMRICIPTTPSQLFHLIRLQVCAHDRHPLIIFSPKSFLRHKDAVSSLDQLAFGCFHEVIFQQIKDKSKVEVLLLCSGKIYYDLLGFSENKGFDKIAIIRVEQLYPFPITVLQNSIKEYINLKTVRWCQEEPKNQGAWSYINTYLQTLGSKKLNIEYIGRIDRAAPAEGHSHDHQVEQDRIIKAAYSLD